MKEKIKSFDNAIIPKKNDQIMVEKVYFWIMLLFKFTCDIFYLLKSIFSEIE